MGGILVEYALNYFDNGESIFKTGEDVFINKVVEQRGNHLHVHDFIEIAYVASGCGIHRIGDSEYNVARGDLFLINYTIPHEFRSLPDPAEPPLVVCNCIFRPEFIDYSLLNCRDFAVVARHFLFREIFAEEYTAYSDIMLLNCDNRAIGELYDKMLAEYSQREPGYLEMLRAYIIELFVIILRLFKRGREETAVEKHRREIIENAVEYLQRNYNQEIKLEELSMMSFLSRNYFCRIFKQHTGITVSEYIQKIRMEEACRLLRETTRKVIDIAADVGYSDIKFFNTVFKRFTGRTPGAYRKESR